MPAVSIIMPLFNDEDWVGRSLASCLAQSSGDFEVICVDDASTDATVAIVRSIAARDPRIRLIEQTVNQSAFQARRRGLEAATAPYVLFLDGDDELAPNAVARTLQAAAATGADVLGFGVEVRTEDGRGAPRFERSLQPIEATLTGTDVVATILAPGRPAQGHLWRYLWRTDLLRTAYASSSADAQFYRANDLPITFMALASAKTYASIADKLYLYNFGRGTSGQAITDLERFRFYLSAVDSVDSIRGAVDEATLFDPTGESIAASYSSARRSIIANVLKQLVENTDELVQPECWGLLRTRVADDLTIVQACATFFPAGMDYLGQQLGADPVGPRTPQRVMITTGNLRAGGVQGVVVAQARLLVNAGYRVTIALFSSAASVYALPDGVRVVHMDAHTEGDRVGAWAELIREHEIDTVIDHHILYNRRWPALALAARAIGVPTIGWLHNFALRPTADGTDGTSYLVRHLPLLATVVVLSQVDVTFWRTLGIHNVVYLPNPPSEVGADPLQIPRQRDGGRIEIAWWGRLQQSTKQARDLIGVAAALEKRGVDFHLSIIGPDSGDLTAADLQRSAERSGVADRVTLVGPLQGEELSAAIDRSHLYVSTSVIEGYPLTLVEAQSRGLGVVMYTLPWLAVAIDNAGIIEVPQGAKSELADAIARVATDDAAFQALSAGSIAAARRALDHDFADLYGRLLLGEVAADSATEPSVADMEMLVRLFVHFSERNARVKMRSATRLQQAIEETAKANRATRRAQRRLNLVKGGPSYRIGRVITYLPRRIREALRR